MFFHMLKPNRTVSNLRNKLEHNRRRIQGHTKYDAIVNRQRFIRISPKWREENHKTNKTYER